MGGTLSRNLNAENLEQFFEMEKNHYRIWKVISTELGIDGDTLSAIEKDHRDDKDCLHAVIDTFTIDYRDYVIRIRSLYNLW